jgi:hypothetical protein
MPFDNLTEKQKNLLTGLVEDLATGSYDSEFRATGTLAGWFIDLDGKDGAVSKVIDDFNKTDLLTLANEGYLILDQSGNYSYLGSLRPKSYEEYKWLINPEEPEVEADNQTMEITVSENVSSTFGDNQLIKILETSKELVSELQKNYELSRNQASQWFLWSLGAALFGFILLGAGAFIALQENGSYNNVSSLSGILTEFIAAIFFSQARHANNRQDTYHKNLIQRQQVLDAVQLTALITDIAERDKVTEAIVKKMLGINN